MDTLSPLFGVAILALVLTANYFYTAWRMGILRAFGRRHPVTWRTLVASSLAGCLPFAGAVVAMAMVPTGAPGEPETSAALLALQLSLCGFVAHALNDVLVQWGMPQATT
ncbi:MAG TPA: hypothetical protein H9903_17895 [Candidatus Aquabacterium excrementipullorum]|nr:hypothetical protein [Candidatus Aquabacterium excrementipullorum]